MDDPMAQDDSSRRSSQPPASGCRIQENPFTSSGGGIQGRGATEVRTKWNNASVVDGAEDAQEIGSFWGVCARSPSLTIFILFFFLLLCCFCFCFCFVFSALGQADITPLRGRHKKAATVLRPHRMKMSTTWRTTTTSTTVPFQRIANWNWNWKKRNETKRRKNWTEMNSGR